VRSLLDVNVLIALLDADHVSHSIATAWIRRHGQEGWASCPLTQNGCVRVMSHSAYPNALPVQSVINQLSDACSQSAHEFWPDEISLLDQKRINTRVLLTSARVTDTYLLALAVHRRARLVTFDRGILQEAVRGATTQHLLIL
jgi:uncharacterized protein